VTREAENAKAGLFFLISKKKINKYEQRNKYEVISVARQALMRT